MNGGASMKLVGKGIGASPGLAEGFIAHTSAVAEVKRTAGLPYIFIAHSLMREDGDAARGATGIVTTAGGITADAAVVARALGKPCIVSANLRLSSHGVADHGDSPFAADARIRIDGLSGEIFSFEG